MCSSSSVAGKRSPGLAQQAVSSHSGVSWKLGDRWKRLVCPILHSVLGLMGWQKIYHNISHKIIKLRYCCPVQFQVLYFISFLQKKRTIECKIKKNNNKVPSILNEREQKEEYSYFICLFIPRNHYTKHVSKEHQNKQTNKK